MEHLLKKIAVATMAIGIASGAAAASFTPAPAPAPASNPAWEIGVQGNYTDHTGDTPVYGGYYYTSSPHSYTVYKTFDPDWEFGFGLLVRYHDGQGRDYSFGWDRLHNDDGSDHFTHANAFAVSPFGNHSSHDALTATQDFEFDRVFAEIGETFQPGKTGNFTMRVSGGAQFISLDHSVWVKTYEYADYSNYYLYDLNSCFWGIGLRGGFDLHWMFGEGFGVFSRTNVGAVYGEIDSKYSLANHNSTPSYQHAKISTQDHIVPTFDGAWGIDWSNGDWTVEAGWRTDALIHAIRLSRGYYNTSHSLHFQNYANAGVFVGLRAKLSGLGL